MNLMDIRERLDQADQMLQHINSVLLFAQEGLDDPHSSENREYNYALHIMAVLKTATDDVRIALDDAMGMLVQRSNMPA